MRSHRLHTALTEFIDSAAIRLQAVIDAGAEVPFELGSRGRRRGATPLYCYRALTGAFIAEHEGELERVQGHDEAVALLAGFDGLDRYLASAGAHMRPGGGRRAAKAALGALLADVFDEQTDFEIRPARLQAALQRLERSESAGTGVTLLATLHGLTIASDELTLTKGLVIAHPGALKGLPDGAGTADGGEDHLIVLLAIPDDLSSTTDRDSDDPLTQGRRLLNDLLRALRLFGDGRVALGALAWARVGDGAFNPVALGTGGRPHGMLVVTVEQEDELRAFCNLVSRRAPVDNELAWALRRFELGCGRENPYEALSDHLLALRALLEPEGPSSGLLAGRLAALCATPEQRVALTERVVGAVALERAFIAGSSMKRGRGQALCSELADHLRALLRDVICGHLGPDLPALADRLLIAQEDADADEWSEQTPASEPVPA
jgi:hypothetical protein